MGCFMDVVDLHLCVQDALIPSIFIFSSTVVLENLFKNGKLMLPAFSSSAFRSIKFEHLIWKLI